MTPSELARVLRAAALECDAIARDQAAERRDWISQADSPIGRKRHCAAVRRRLERGDDGAAIVGRRHLLSPGALTEVLTELGRKPAPAPTTEASLAAELDRRLRLVGGSL